MKYYHGKSRTTKVWQLVDEPWEKFRDRLLVENRGHETMDEWVEINKTDLGSQLKDVGAFVGGLLKDGHRGKGSVRARTMVTLDADSVVDDIWSLYELLYGNAAVMYQTRSWRPEKPKVRLVVPLSEPVSPDLGEAIARHMAHDLGMHNFDRTTFQPERLMYYPSLPADAPHCPMVCDGALLDVAAWVDDHPDWDDLSTWPRHEKDQIVGDRGTDKKLEDPREKPGIIGAFCRAYSISEAIWMFLSDKYEEGEGGRYTYVGATGKNGLVVYDDLLCYSHHSTDPLSELVDGRQHEYNAWDLVRVHLFGRDDKTLMFELAEADEKVKVELEAERGRAAEAFMDDNEPRPRKMFFRRQGKQELFTPMYVAEWYLSLSPCAKMGGDLYRYEDGVYVPADAHFVTTVTRALATEFSSARLKDSLNYLMGIIEEITCPFGDYINVRNGLLDASTGTLISHSPLHLSTVRVPWRYDPEAKCPVTEAFFKEYAGEHWELVWYMIAYCLLPTMRFEKIFILYGPGGNGKGTTLGLLQRLLGKENVANAALQKLESNNFMAADLVGKLANIQADLPNSLVKSDGVVKSLASGDRIRVERKNRDGFSTTIRAKLMFSTNSLPKTTDTTNGWFRKQCIISYNKQFINKGERELMDEEIEGILAKAVEYAIKLSKMDKFPGDGDLEMYRIHADSVCAFSNDCCEKAENHVTMAEMYSSYKDYCRDEGNFPLGKKHFNEKLAAYLPWITKYKLKTGWVWKGVKLLDLS